MRERAGSRARRVVVDEAVLRQITRAIVEGFGPLKVILFGSHARGDAGPDSDVDLLVVMESAERPAARAAHILATCRPRFVAMDVLVRTPAEIERRLAGFDPFLESVLREGRILYDAYDAAG